MKERGFFILKLKNGVIRERSGKIGDKGTA